MLLALGQVFGWQSGGEDEQKENKEEQADATSKRGEQKKIDGRTENIWRFEHTSGGRGEICVAAAGLRIILLFRGYKVLKGRLCLWCPLRFLGDVSLFDDVLASLSRSRGVGLPTTHRTPLLSSVKCCRARMKAAGFTDRGQSEVNTLTCVFMRVCVCGCMTECKLWSISVHIWLLMLFIVSCTY